jgi:2,4-diaminopentanoate dehydrogenase
MSGYTVIQWGTGAVGTHALRFIVEHPELELVGVKCHTRAKHGMDAGVIAGIEPTGITATQSAEELIALDADCVLYMPRDTLQLDPTVPGSPSREWVDQVLPILRSGKNVITPIANGMHWMQLANGGELRDELQAAGVEGGASIYFTGIDPGFVTDALAITMSSVCCRIEQLRTWEFIDYSNYPVPEVMLGMGYGRLPKDIPATAASVLRTGWGGAIYSMADAFGLTIDEVRLDLDHYLSPRTVTVASGLTIKAGTIGAMRWSLAGVVDGRDRLSINHVNRMGSDMAPDWPNLGTEGGYRIEVDGFPPYRGEFPLALPGGTGHSLDDAVIMTAARCVNAIAAAVQSEPGYRTINELVNFGARFGFPPVAPAAARGPEAAAPA